MRANNNVELEIAPEVAELIVERCTETETGARNIETILAGSVLPKLAHRMLERMSGGEMPPRAELYVDEDKSFALRFSDEPSEEQAEVPEEHIRISIPRPKLRKRNSRRVKFAANNESKTAAPRHERGLRRIVRIVGSVVYKKRRLRGGAMRVRFFPSRR